MSINVFVSYSHKDEAFKENLSEHISPLKRLGVINEWHDRKIIAGQAWAGQISEHLSSSELIIFLISSSFLDSDYCINVEVKKAMEMHEEGRAILIPIIIRPSDWESSPLSKLQALPKDAKAVSSWSNIDEAWLNVVHGIKDALDKFTPAKEPPMRTEHTSEFSLVESNNYWLNDTEITLTHRNVNRINLSDIYVTPDIELESDGKHDLRTFTNASKIIPKYNKVIFSGEEQQGKTSLLKYYYKLFLDKWYYPIFLDGGKIKDSNSEQVLSKEITQQYNNATYVELARTQKIVILIDNIDSIVLNRKHRDSFLQEICEKYEYCIFTLQLSFSLLIDEIPALSSFKKAELFGLGNKKREELIQKWISLGVEQTISENELYSRCDELKDSINSVVKKNIVPSKPIYILMLLQMSEANSKLNLELSSHGHCYQQLIYQSFENAKINDREFDKYLNVLTELAWWIFKNNEQPNEAQLDSFFSEYCENYLEVDSATVIRKLTDHSILQVKAYRTGFKYSYIYYFFVGKKIAESYSEEERVKEKVEYLITNLHREDFANILIFVAHHTKDTWLISRLKLVLTELFNEHDAASLDKEQLAFMDEFMKQIPELILEQREVQKERDKHNDEMDKIERAKANDQDEPLDILANINKTFKGMEIAGQIIKNRHASLKRDSLTALAEDGINSGLRFLKYFISISSVTKNEIVKIISTHLSENPSLTNSQIEKHAENAYLHLTYGVINGVVRKIATSVGTKEAMEIYEAIEEKVNTKDLTKSPALLLLKQSIELHFLKRVDINNITECVEKLKGNYVCTRILKELIVQHIYMFPVSYREKQQLSALLNLSVKGQQLIEKKQKAIS